MCLADVDGGALFLDLENGITIRGILFLNCHEM